MKHSILYLVGFMGAGKTSVGRCLAELLGWRFVDLDAEIEAREGTSVRELFRTKGEPYFREVEREELQRCSSQRGVVMALGGGAFCSDENRRIIESTGTSVWLDAPIDLLYSRCEGDAPSRPLFSTRAEMEALLERRRPLYAKADLRIETCNLTVDDLTQKILQELKNF